MTASRTARSYRFSPRAKQVRRRIGARFETAEPQMPMELVQPTEDVRAEPGGDLAVMLTGGGARAAYQVGVIKGLARHFPNLRFQIITGVSAGAINAIFLAAHDGPLRESAADLAALWCSPE